MSNTKVFGFRAHLGEHLGSYPQAKCSGHLGEHMVSTKTVSPCQIRTFGEHQTEHMVSRRGFVLTCSLL